MADTWKTGALASTTGVYECSSCGSTIRMEQGEHLPPCPSERKAVEWRLGGTRIGEREAAQPRGRERGGGMGGT